MNADDSTLVQGEHVVFATHLHWIVLVAPLTFSAALGIAGLLFVTRPDFLRDRLDDVTAAAAMLFPSAAHDSTAVGLTLVVIAALAALAGVWQRYSAELIVTDRRVMLRTGVAVRRTLEILLPKIESVEVDQTPWGRALGFGTVVVRGSGGTPEPLSAIADPLAFRREVETQIEAAARPRRRRMSSSF